MTKEEFYKLTDILNSEVLGNFMHGGEADELIAMFEEAVEHSNILEQEEPISKELEEAAKNHAVERYRVTRDRELAEKCKWSFKAGAKWQEEKDNEEKVLIYKHGFEDCKKQVSEDSKKEFPKVWDRETLDEYAYQVAYDLSNDWMRETATWDDVETAVKLGAKWQKERKENG